MSIPKEPIPKQLEDLYSFFQQQGVFETQDAFMNYINTEGIGTLYPYIAKGTFSNSQEFVSYYEPFLKKKDETSGSGSASGVKVRFLPRLEVGIKNRGCFFGFTYGK